MKLDTNNHSVFMLHYHLIMCVKYRNKVIDDIISNRLKEIFEKDIYVLQNSIPAVRTNVRRLILIYDYLKWGK